MTRFLLTLLCLIMALRAHAATPWTRTAATALLDYGQRIGSHGLDPRDYELERLRGALAAGYPPARSTGPRPAASR